MTDQEALNQLAGAAMELQKNGYGLTDFNIEERKERGLRGSVAWREITVRRAAVYGLSRFFLVHYSHGCNDEYYPGPGLGTV
jgi:hypothetical protein